MKCKRTEDFLFPPTGAIGQYRKGYENGYERGKAELAEVLDKISAEIKAEIRKHCERYMDGDIIAEEVIQAIDSIGKG